MGRLFPVSIGLLSNFLEFVAGFFPGQPLKGFIISKVKGPLVSLEEVYEIKRVDSDYFNEASEPSQKPCSFGSNRLYYWPNLWHLKCAYVVAKVVDDVDRGRAGDRAGLSLAFDAVHILPKKYSQG
jgi:hypothetical protein